MIGFVYELPEIMNYSHGIRVLSKLVYPAQELQIITDRAILNTVLVWLVYFTTIITGWQGTFATGCHPIPGRIHQGIVP